MIGIIIEVNHDNCGQPLTQDSLYVEYFCNPYSCIAIVTLAIDLSPKGSPNADL